MHLNNILNNKTVDESTALTLSELNLRVHRAVTQAFPEVYWLRAEMSDVRVNGASGHCYLEFIEKNPHTGQLVAKARGTIWAKTFRLLKPYFEEETGQYFTSGLKVLVQVSVDFHELYGYGLNVLDIDPSYTLGDQIRQRMEIVRRLKEDGVYELNKELELPLLCRRIAVISSPTAAGYGDFVNQLEQATAGYPFYLKLFPALMQGDKTEESVLAALERIYNYVDYFDAVVIIRGGGATSDLTSFDSYLLAAACAQFPLPILTGIGHERDDTVVDLVAHTRLKTPTAVAAFLIARMDEVAEDLTSLQRRLCDRVKAQVNHHQTQLQLLSSRLPAYVTSKIERNRTSLEQMTSRLPLLTRSLFKQREVELAVVLMRLSKGIRYAFSDQQHRLQVMEQMVKISSPDYLLQKGYSLTLQNGKVVRKASDLKPGDCLVTRLADGTVFSIVTEK